MGIAWWVSLLILTLYYLLVFRVPVPMRMESLPDEHPPVSIIIAVKNGSQLLEANLPALVRQDYPAFEIILVDDHSTDREKEALMHLQVTYPKIRLIHSDRSPGKKYALSLGVESATHPWILVTDADCHPSSLKWIRKMMAYRKSNAMVLGYSPYQQESGWLNQFVRFETLMTGMQYLSWAAAGRPYMGVGRNLLFQKQSFLQIDPYRLHPGIPYGDDDLWVQAARKKLPVRVCYDPETFVITRAPNTWSGWIRQKHRHLSAGRYYTLTTWWQPGLFGIAWVLHWILILPLFLTTFSVYLLMFFLMGLTIRWAGCYHWARTLKESRLNTVYPLYEVAYAVYLATVGLMTLLVKKKTWN